jgi:MFS transporter, MHS family, proline/betaine transporter
MVKMQNNVKPKHIILLASIGTGLEYYDFVIYAFLASFISNSFFPNTTYYVSMMATFATFGIGYIVRPIGGVFFGIIGDRYGRKKALTLTIFLMAISTFLMSIMPSYSHWGLLAPLIFIFLRILQGLSYGAELPGSLTFLIEHITPKNRGKKCGLMVSSMGIGVTVASFISYLVTHFLTLEQMNLWGWRLPFMFGGSLALVGYFLRKYASETPLFIKTEKHELNVLIKILKNNYKNVLRGFGCATFPACLVVFGLFMPSYLHDYFKYELPTIYLISTFGHILAAVLLPILGWYSDYIGRKRLLIIALIIIMLSILPLFKWLTYESTLALWGFILCYHVMLAFLGSCYFTILAESFPTSIRYIGITLCYNLANTFAAFIPIVFSYICKNVINPENVSVVFIALALLSIFSTFTILDQTGRELDSSLD